MLYFSLLFYITKISAANSAWFQVIYEFLGQPWWSPMIYILAGSSLKGALDNYPKTKRRLSRSGIAVSGLNLHPNPKDPTKQGRFQLLQRGVKSHDQILIWHDVVNNTIISPKSHKSKKVPCTTEELIKHLKSLENVVGIVYCQRKVTDNISQQLKRTGIPTLIVVKDLLSKRKSKDKKLVRRYQVLHQHPFL